MKRYKELKIDGKLIYNENEIDNILVEYDMNWLLDAEIKNSRLEIIKDTLVWNAGIWYNGVWKYGVFRSGQWSSGIWENGVWYNGIWKTGTFKNGLIYGGDFLGGEILAGSIRGGNYHEIKILTNVKKETKDMNKVEETNRTVVNNNPIIDDSDNKYVEATLDNLRKKDYIHTTDMKVNSLINKSGNFINIVKDPLDDVTFPNSDDLVTYK